MEIPVPVVSAMARAVNFTNEGGINGTIRLLKNIAGLWLLQECRRSWQRQGHEYSWDELMALASGAPAFASVINPDAHEFLNPDDMPFNRIANATVLRCHKPPVRLCAVVSKVWRCATAPCSTPSAN